MDLGCNCLGMATAARVPVKRYNLLVPDVFPVVEPPFGQPLGITIERKVKKLGDYLDKNEHRAPKVSRRLQRRLYKELQSGHLGYVQLAVATYSALLAGGRPEKSGLLANELVVRTVVKRRTLPFGHKVYLRFPEPHLGSVTGLLLSHERPQLRRLGVDLLIDFLKCQHTSDYVPQLEAFVPLLCANAKPHATVQRLLSLPAAEGGSPTKGGPKQRRSASAGMAAEMEEAEAWNGLRASCLRALLEHLRFCARLSYVSYHLHTITFAVLECVEASGQGAPAGRYTSPRALLESAGGSAGRDAALASMQGLSRGSISHAVAASPPDVAALLVFEELAHMTRDAAEGKKVLEFVMRFLDGHARWLGSPVAETSLAVLQQACEAEHQRYLLFSSLLRHVGAAEALAPAERAAVLDLALGEARQLEAGLAAPALLLALRELPPVIAAHAGGGHGEVPPMPAASALPLPPPAPAAAAAAAAAAVAVDAADDEATSPAAAAAVPGSAQEVELARVATTPVATTPALATAADRYRAVDLQPLVLAAVQRLALRVEDSGQLLEAVGSTVTKLRGAAPISTAGLQCCVAAAGALTHLAPRTTRTTSAPMRTGVPSLLVQELAGIAVVWEPQQRLLAHRLLHQLLPLAADGLKEQQAAALLSAAWHAAALADNGPAAYVALDGTLRGALRSAPAASLPQAVKLLAGLQEQALQAGGRGGPDGPGPDGSAAPAPADGGRLAALSAAQTCALLCTCRSVLHALAAQLGQPELQRLAVPGCEAVLQCLSADPAQGLLLQGPAGGVGGSSAQQQQQFWAAGAPAAAFSDDEQHSAAALLQQWRQGTTAAAQQAALVAALQGVPLFKQQEAAAGAPFRPIPLASLMPRLMQQAHGNGSAGSESRRAARLRSVYRHMRQVSLCDGDRAVLATISQESAAEEPAGPAFQLRGLGLPELGSEGEVSGGGGAPEQSADEVLAEVEAALAEAAEALERGRSPSPPAWSSLPPSRQGSVASPGEAQALGVAAASAARSAHAKLSVVL